MDSTNPYKYRHAPEGYLKYLPGTKPPKSDELLSSWIIRLAHSHLLKAHSFTKELWPKLEIWNRDIDLNPNPNVIKSLSEMTCYSEDEIYNTTLQTYKGILFNNHASTIANANWVLSLSKYHRTIRNKAILFCPSCLMNDGIEPYFRKKWRLAFSFCCVSCKVKLHDCCPECGKPVMYIRNEIGMKSKLSQHPISYCSNCNFDLAKTPQIKPDIEDIKLQIKLNNLINVTNDCNKYSYEYFQVLHFLCNLISSKSKLNQSIVAAIYNEFNMINYLERDITKRRFELNSLEYRLQILHLATWLISDWPNNFIAFFTKLDIHSSKLLKDFHDYPIWYHQTVMTNFFLSNEMRAHKREK